MSYRRKGPIRRTGECDAFGKLACFTRQVSEITGKEGMTRVFDLFWPWASSDGELDIHRPRLALIPDLDMQKKMEVMGEHMITHLALTAISKGTEADNTLLALFVEELLARVEQVTSE